MRQPRPSFRLRHDLLGILGASSECQIIGTRVSRERKRETRRGLANSALSFIITLPPCRCSSNQRGSRTDRVRVLWGSVARRGSDSSCSGRPRIGSGHDRRNDRAPVQGKDTGMSRFSLLLATLACAAGAVGCTHCDTCDDFPTPYTGQAYGHAVPAIIEQPTGPAVPGVVTPTEPAEATQPSTAAPATGPFSQPSSTPQPNPDAGTAAPERSDSPPATPPAAPETTSPTPNRAP